MTKKRPWNIWRIKNRWLRAVFTALVMAPIVLFLFVFCAALSILDGVIEGGKHAWWVFNRDHDTSIYASFWRAVTLREAK